VSIFGRQHAATRDALPREGRSPGFDGAVAWLNSPALAGDDLRGKVVLVDFWTYTCINWLRTLPYVRAWAERYADRGLVVVGVHTPEFPFEHDLENVRRLVPLLEVAHPVAVDSDYAVWDAFSNHYWPALYLVDQEGTIRFHHFGEGRYEDSERAIQQLLGVDEELVSVVGLGLEADADWEYLRSPETYLGYARGERFASPGDAVGGGPGRYAIPEDLRTNMWALEGAWTIRPDAVVLDEAGGRLAYRFDARDVHLVLAPPARDAECGFQVLLDGEPPGAGSGEDVDEQGRGVVSEPRLHQLVRQPARVEERTFEIRFDEPGVEAYAFTFG
jgi:thiol-disulfide isomerase/thioredoxin